MTAKKDDATVPFFKMQQSDRRQAIQHMRTYTGGDPAKLDTEIVKTAFKSLIGIPGSGIAGVPSVVEGHFGPTLRIPLKDFADPAFASLAQLRSFI